VGISKKKRVSPFKHLDTRRRAPRHFSGKPFQSNEEEKVRVPRKTLEGIRKRNLHGYAAKKAFLSEKGKVLPGQRKSGTASP